MKTKTPKKGSIAGDLQWSWETYVKMLYGDRKMPKGLETHMHAAFLAGACSGSLMMRVNAVKESEGIEMCAMQSAFALGEKAKKK